MSIDGRSSAVERFVLALMEASTGLGYDVPASSEDDGNLDPDDVLGTPERSRPLDVPGRG